MAMSKTSVTRYRRRRYYRRYRRYRGLSNQYFRAKIEGVYTIAWPTQVGDPVFAEVNGPSLTFGAVFSSSQYYGSLVNMFGYYKVYGVAMEVAPGPNNLKGNLSSVGAKVLVGFKCGTSTTMPYHELVANNNSILLGVGTGVRKYSSIMGSNGWVSVSDNIDKIGNFSVASSLTGTLDRFPTWTCRFSLYMVFKKVNI